MAENEGLDLSKVINLIMENPKLIEEISALAKGDKHGTPETTQNASVEEETEEKTALTPKDITYASERPHRSKRNELLCAMKPYLSKERARAIDSVLTIVDILGVMKER